MNSNFMMTIYLKLIFYEGVQNQHLWLRGSSPFFPSILWVAPFNGEAFCCVYKMVSSFLALHVFSLWEAFSLYDLFNVFFTFFLFSFSFFLLTFGLNVSSYADENCKTWGGFNVFSFFSFFHCLLNFKLEWFYFSFHQKDLRSRDSSLFRYHKFFPLLDLCLI